jgi:hypothetical protein
MHAGSCKDNYMKCDNARCVRERYRCDGDNDCGDMSDERNCGGSSSSPQGSETNFPDQQSLGCIRYDGGISQALTNSKENRDEHDDLMINSASSGDT